MITGAHAILYSKDAEKDRAFLRDVLGFKGVDAGGGWLIFALPPSELAVHPGEENGRHEVYLTCDDIAATVRQLKARKAKVSPMRELDWGKLVMVSLPAGGELGLYEPKHPQPR
jgi:catechol 2,3-dioxygenase-like lactoylglutathione lyase family enzyme